MPRQLHTITCEKKSKTLAKSGRHCPQMFRKGGVNTPVTYFGQHQSTTMQYISIHVVIAAAHHSSVKSEAAKEINYITTNATNNKTLLEGSTRPI